MMDPTRSTPPCYKEGNNEAGERRDYDEEDVNSYREMKANLSASYGACLIASS